MDSEELDAWYEEQKEILFDKYVNEKDKDKKAEEKYKKSMESLRKKYEKSAEKLNRISKIIKIKSSIKQNISNILKRFKK